MSYRYTVNNELLTGEQRRFYEKNGFLVIKNLIPQNELEKYRERFVDICHRRVGDTVAMTIMKDVSLVDKEGVDPERIVNKVQDYQADPVLSQYFRLPQILKYVECFTGKDVAARHTMLINKPPDPGTKTSRHPFHQDLYYFPFRPADRIVCSWTAMQRVDRNNGCLVVIPGTHTGELLRHGYPNWENGVNKMYHGIQDYKVDEKQLVYLEMDCGDTVFFHPILIHGSGRNKTDGFRKAISCHFSACHTHYIDVKGTIQEDLAKEVLEIAEKRYPSGSWNYEMIWEAKKVLLQGRDSHHSAL